MHQRTAARRRAIRLCFTEILEGRTLLHEGPGNSTDISVAMPGSITGQHVAASILLQAMPQLAGKDLWSPSTFNPTGSNNRSDWLYDPHYIEDDITPASELYPKPAAGPEASALPDLVPLTNGYLAPFIDTTEIAGHNLMRFSTAVGNMGAGPAALTSANSGTPPAGSGITSWINPDGSQNVLQQIYTYNGSTFSFQGYRPAGRMVWHSGHSHFHLEGYANYRLLTKNADGTPGPVAKRTGFDGADAVGDKIGFCLINILGSFTLPGTSTSSSTLPGYNKAGQPSTGCGFLQGISVGRADVYDSVYDGQWIDVTGVPNGNYFLEVTLDAMNVIEESNEVNNRVLVPYTLNAASATGGAIQADRFEPNNTPATATNLGELGVQTQPGLTAHISNESDYFQFVAASTGPGSVSLTISNRDVNLYLYDSSLTLLGSSTSPTLGTATTPATENINYNFVAGQTYYVRAAGFGTSTDSGGISTGYALKVTINPTINVTAPTANAREADLSSGMITIARNGPVSSPLLVNFTVGGTATRGVDYAIFQDGVPITGNSVSLGNEASTANLEIVPLADSLVESNETITLTLSSNAAYFLGSGTAATVVLADTPPALLTSTFGFETDHRVSFDFSLDVSASLSATDLILTNLTTGAIIAASAVDYVAATNRATFRFASTLPDGNYEARIPAAAVTHSAGAALSADAVTSFFVLAGDVNRDRIVDFADLLVVVQNYGETGRTFSQGNTNYDAAGDVNFNDVLIVSQNYGTATIVSRGDRIATKRRVVDILE